MPEAQHPELRKVKRILIIQLGDIGDVVWGIPTLRAVKESIPGAKLYVAVKEGFGDLLQMEPAIDEVFEVKNYRGGWISRMISQIRFFRSIRSGNPDLAIDLRAGDRGAFLAFLSGAPKRVTIRYEEVPFWRNLLFTDILDLPPYILGVRGASDQSLRIVRELGIDTKDTTPRLAVPEAVLGRVRELLNKEGLSGDSAWLTLNPFSRWAYKELPEEKWIDVIRWLGSAYRVTTVMVGSPDERQKAERMKSACPGPVVNLAGKTTLPELAGVLKLSRMHIGVDSAAPHIAAAVGTPTITVYGPSDWREWAPVGAQHRVVFPDRDCVPCRQKGCQGTEQSQCLEELDVEKIKEMIQRSMGPEDRSL